MCLYTRIKSRREELGMSQEELANKLGYKSRSTINKIESGTNDIPQSKIKAFADALKTTPAYLMGWDTSSNKKEKEITLTESEMEHLLKYRQLDEKGQHTVSTILEMEYNRCTNDYLMPVAAHNDNITDQELELINKDLAEMDNW